MCEKELLKCTLWAKSVHFFVPSTLKKHPQNHALYDAFLAFFVVFLVSHLGPGNSQNVKKHKINVKNIKKTRFFQGGGEQFFLIFEAILEITIERTTKKKVFFCIFLRLLACVLVIFWSISF